MDKTSPQSQSIQQQNYQQSQLAGPYAAYKSMNSGSNGSNNVNVNLSGINSNNYPSKLFRSINSHISI